MGVCCCGCAVGGWRGVDGWVGGISVGDGAREETGQSVSEAESDDALGVAGAEGYRVAVAAMYSVMYFMDIYFVEVMGHDSSGAGLALLYFLPGMGGELQSSTIPVGLC